MALAIDGSSPAVATQPTNTVATVTTASFTPPANSLLLVMWDGDAAGTPAAPTITDNLGTPLTYSRTDWQSIADAPTAHGQAAAWTAPVASSAAMTVTVTSGSASGERCAALTIRVLTDTNGQPTVGAHGKSGSVSASSIAQSYSAQATGGWGFLGSCDFDQMGAETAGTGCTLIGSANVSTAITYGFVRRTSADDTNGNSNTLNVTLPATSTNLTWVYVEILPAATTASPAQGSQSTGRHPGAGPSNLRFLQSPRASDYFSAWLNDTGTSTDTLTVAAAVPLTDAATGADAISVAAAVPLTDTAAAVDALTVQDVTVGAAVPSPLHPGRGPTTARFYQTPRSTDVNLSTPIALADTGAGSDALTVTATVPLADTAVGDDQVTVAAAVPLSDTATGTDAISVAAAVPLTDAATGADAVTVAATVPLTDAATATDTIAVAATVPLADAAAAVDALTVLDVTISAAVGATSRPWHPGRGPTAARFYQTPRSTGRVLAAVGQISGSAIGLGGMEEAGAVSATESASSALSAGIQ